MKYKSIDEGTIKAINHIGDTSGYLCFVDEGRYWHYATYEPNNSFELRQIANKLDELNKKS